MNRSPPSLIFGYEEIGNMEKKAVMLVTTVSSYNSDVQKLLMKQSIHSLSYF